MTEVLERGVVGVAGRELNNVPRWMTARLCVKAPASQAVIGQKALIHFPTAVLSVALRPPAVGGGSRGLFTY